MKLEEVNIYRIVHIENIEHILQYGITHKSSINSNAEFVSIGDISLIDTRSTRTVIVDNGDLTNMSLKTITLGDFIPFYFGVKMPMLYVIQNGGNFVKKATPSKNIVYLACSVTRVIESRNIYYFSDGHATDNLTSFYDDEKIIELPKIIEWDAIRAPFWGGSENLNIKRKKQAEFLVHGDLPASTIIGFGCQNDDSKKILLNLGVPSENVTRKQKCRRIGNLKYTGIGN